MFLIPKMEEFEDSHPDGTNYAKRDVRAALLRDVCLKIRG